MTYLGLFTFTIWVGRVVNFIYNFSNVCANSQYIYIENIENMDWIFSKISQYFPTLMSLDHLLICMHV